MALLRIACALSICPCNLNIVFVCHPCILYIVCVISPFYLCIPFLDIDAIPFSVVARQIPPLLSPRLWALSYLKFIPLFLNINNKCCFEQGASGLVCVHQHEPSKSMVCAFVMSEHVCNHYVCCKKSRYKWCLRGDECVSLKSWALISDREGRSFEFAFQTSIHFFN